MSEQSQAEAIAFLSDGANLPGGAPARVIRTHGALVILSGRDAYKMKRAVRYDYLDFSTPEKRRAMLTRELELNRPAAPMIYRDVVAITRAADGGLELDGAGAAVDWVLRMHRFDTSCTLDKLAQQGALDDRVAQDLGQVVAQYHARAAPCRQAAGADRTAGVLDGLDRSLAGMTDMLDAQAVARWRHEAPQALDRAAAMLDSRAGAGQVRRVHGDLHLRNIVLLEGRPVLFDALEFDERLATCDVLFDLAFLLMDLCHAGLKRAANIVLNSYLFAADDGDHLAGLSVLPLFLSLRAATRAMVGVQAARLDPGAQAREDARAYLARALACLRPAPARLIAVGGLSGTGKTVLSRALAPFVGAAPGAIHLRSDLERKALFGVAPLSRLPQSAYSPEVSALVQDTLCAKARAALCAGQSVILDATWLEPRTRAMLPPLAEGAGADFTGLWLTAGQAILETRVDARRDDASDADVAVLRRQRAARAQMPDWARVDASGPLDRTLAAALRVLGIPAPPDACGSGS